MTLLVPSLLLFIFIKLINSQHLQEQTQYHIEPVKQAQVVDVVKNSAKRTVGAFRHYILGKHVGLHPLGFKYVLGYSPIPMVKPVTILRPLHHNIKPIFATPAKQYLQPVLHPSTPINDNGWKPIVPEVSEHKPWIPEVPQSSEIAAKPNPIQNYVYFQSPVAKPLIPPQFHISRPQLPVLPFGASFLAPVLQPSHPQINVNVPNPSTRFHFPPYSQLPLLSSHQQASHPVYHPKPIYHAQQNLPLQQIDPATQPISTNQQSPGEFHGNHLHSLTKQYLLALLQSIPSNSQFPQMVIEGQPHPIEVQFKDIAPHYTHPEQLPDQPETRYLPSDYLPEAPFNPAAAIQPGETDVQVPQHLPHHPHLKPFDAMAFIHPQKHLEPPPQTPLNYIRPSLSLEAPYRGDNY